MDRVFKHALVFVAYFYFWIIFLQFICASVGQLVQCLFSRLFVTFASGKIKIQGVNLFCSVEVNHLSCSETVAKNF